MCKDAACHGFGRLVRPTPGLAGPCDKQVTKPAKRCSAVAEAVSDVALGLGRPLQEARLAWRGRAVQRERQLFALLRAERDDVLAVGGKDPGGERRFTVRA